MPASFVTADRGAFDAAHTPDAVTVTASFAVTVEINVTAYADEYGGTPADEPGVVDHVRDMILECVPSHLRGALLVAVREDSRAYPGVTHGTGATS